MLSLKDYLDMEFKGIDMSNGLEPALEKYVGTDSLHKFLDLVCRLEDAWGSMILPSECVEQAEEDIYNFYYSNDLITKILNCSSRHEDELIMKFVAENGLKNGNTLVDFGCGCGVKTGYYAMMGKDVTGVDRLSSAIKLLNERKEKYKISNLKGLQANLVNIDMVEMFDIALATNMLHECGDNAIVSYCCERKMPKKINNIYRCLNKNGIFIATVKAFEISDIEYDILDNMSSAGFGNIERKEIAKYEDVTILGFTGRK